MWAFFGCKTWQLLALSSPKGFSCGRSRALLLLLYSRAVPCLRFYFLTAPAEVSEQREAFFNLLPPAMSWRFPSSSFLFFLAIEVNSIVAVLRAPP